MTKDAITRKLAELRADQTVNLAPSTRITYAKLWSYFEAWCEVNDFEALPATPTTVVGYLMDRHEAGLAPTTLKSVRNAIATQHRLAGLDRPTDHDDVKTCLRLLRRASLAAGRGTPKQARPIRLEHIRRLEGDKPLDGELDGNPFGDRWTDADERRHTMDCAVVSCMHAGFLRVSEAAALRWSDIRFLANGRAQLTIQSSKTSATPEPVTLSSRATGWLREIMPKSPDMEARVFRVKTGRAIHNRIVRCMSRIRPGATGHSPRVGAAQDATLRGVPLQHVMVMGRWRNLAMPAYYASKVTAEVNGANVFEDDDE